ADPYVVSLQPGASIDGVVDNAHLPTPKLRFDSALNGFAADLNGPQVGRLLDDPAVVAVEPDTAIEAHGMEAMAAGETLPTDIRRSGAAAPPLVHQAASVGVAVLDTGVDLANPDI